MEVSALIAVTAPFFKVVGEIVADLKRQELASIDTELLRLKRTVLAEKLGEFESNLATAATREKAQAVQSLISRGLANTTIRESELRSIDKKAADESEKAHREYNRAIEEIALMERKLAEQAIPWWKKLLRKIGL